MNQNGGGPNAGLAVNIVNQNAANILEPEPEVLPLHWYVPLTSPATRRVLCYDLRIPTGITAGALLVRHLWLPTARRFAPRLGLAQQLFESTRQHVSIGFPPASIFFIKFSLPSWSECSEWLPQTPRWLRPHFAVLGQLATNVRRAAFNWTPPRWRFLPATTRPLGQWMLRHAWWVRPVLATIAGLAACTTLYCFWWNRRQLALPYEPEGLGQRHVMCEVTQEEALQTPTHFACPAALRAVVLEKVFLSERTPALVQRIKSIAGRWCDDHGVGPFERPACIAGAVAAAMTVSTLEMDLVRYEQQWSVRTARRLLRDHHAEEAPRHQPAFWDWLTGPGRR